MDILAAIKREERNINKPIVWAFPELLVCFDCGNSGFAVSDAQLRVLAEVDVGART